MRGCEGGGGNFLIDRSHKNFRHHTFTTNVPERGRRVKGDDCGRFECSISASRTLLGA